MEMAEANFFPPYLNSDRWYPFIFLPYLSGDKGGRYEFKLYLNSDIDWRIQSSNRLIAPDASDAGGHKTSDQHSRRT